MDLQHKHSQSISTCSYCNLHILIVGGVVGGVVGLVAGDVVGLIVGRLVGLSIHWWIPTAPTMRVV